MQFFRLTNPDYETDHEQMRLNPVKSKHEFFLPSMRCDVCGDRTGGLWASSDKYRVPIPQDIEIRKRLQPYQAMTPDEWFPFARNLENLTGLQEGVLRPGGDIGLPQGGVARDEVLDFVHVPIGMIWVKPKVIKAIREAGLTGISWVRVETFWQGRMKGRTDSPPELWELVVTGRAWRQGMEKVIDCPRCERQLFPDPRYMVIDEQRWDGTDFFITDDNPNIVSVTPRVCETFRQHQFTNWLCKDPAARLSPF